MAAEIETPPVTGCKHDFAQDEHVILDLHEILRRLHAFEQLADDLKPLIERYKTTGGGTIGLMRTARGPGRRGT